MEEYVDRIRVLTDSYTFQMQEIHERSLKKETKVIENRRYAECALFITHALKSARINASEGLEELAQNFVYSASVLINQFGLDAEDELSRRRTKTLQKYFNKVHKEIFERYGMNLKTKLPDSNL